MLYHPNNFPMPLGSGKLRQDGINPGLKMEDYGGPDSAYESSICPCSRAQPSSSSAQSLQTSVWDAEYLRKENAVGRRSIGKTIVEQEAENRRTGRRDTGIRGRRLKHDCAYQRRHPGRGILQQPLPHRSGRRVLLHRLRSAACRAAS